MVWIPGAKRSARPVWAAFVLGAAVCSGCGLRTDSFLGVDAGTGPEPGETGYDPNREGSCNDPFFLPWNDPIKVTGTLAGEGGLEGWCGRDNGPEDVYRVTPTSDLDVRFEFLPGETDFAPVLRIKESGCETNEGEAVLCAVRAIENQYHFYFRRDREYSVIVDSSDGSEGDYAFNVYYDDVPIEWCNVHSETISQQQAGTFLWENTFGAGQGLVDSQCGATPGRENFFRMTTTYPGFVHVTVSGSGGFKPVVSLRNDCRTASEFECTEAPGAVASLDVFLSDPGTYYLSVDEAGHDGGSFALDVLFD